MRITFWRRGDWEPPAYRPLLLDQVSATALDRRAAGTWQEPPAERSPRLQRRRVSLLTRGRRIVLPAVMLGLGALVTTSMVFGSIDTLSDGDVSWQDALRVAIMALLSLLFLVQLASLAGRLPGVSRILGRLRRPPLSPPLPMLDQVSAGTLMRQAPPELGQSTRARQLSARGRRLIDATSWFALVAFVVGVGVFTGVGAAFGAWSAFGQDGIGVSTLLQVLFLAIAGVSVFFLAMVGLRGLRQRGQRRRSRLLRRILYFVLRFFDTTRRVAGDVTGVSSRAGEFALVRSGGSAFLPASNPIAAAPSIIQATTTGTPAITSAPFAGQSASTAARSSGVGSAPGGGAGAPGATAGSSAGGGIGGGGGAVPPGNSGGPPVFEGGGLVTPPGGSGGPPVFEGGGLVTPPGGSGGPPVFEGGGLVTPPGGSGGPPVFEGGGLVTPPGGGGGGLTPQLEGGLVTPGGGGGDGGGGLALDGGIVAPFAGDGSDGGDGELYLYGGKSPGAEPDSYLVYPDGFDLGDDDDVAPYWKPGVVTGAVLALAFLPMLFGGGGAAAGDGGGAGEVLGAGFFVAPLSPTPTSTPTATPTPTELPAEAPTEAPAEAPTIVPGGDPAATQPPLVRPAPSATPVPPSPAPPFTTPQPTATPTLAPSNTPLPTRTPTPTNTPLRQRPTSTPTPCSFCR